MPSQDQGAKLLALIAHEIRSPLSVITNTAQLLDMKEDATPEERACYELIMRQARQIDDTANTLISISRIKLGKDPIPRDDFLLCEQLFEVIESSRHLFEKKSMRVRLETPPHATTVSGSKILFKQAMINLLNNALKFSPSNSNVHVNVSQENERVVVSVKDEGRGLDPNETRSLFSLYVQSGDNSNRSGLGMGLYLVKKIARLHGGGVSVSSEGHGKGCDFRLWLPISDSTLMA